MLLNKVLAYEEMIKKQDEDMKLKDAIIEELQDKCKHLELYFQQQLQMITHDRDELERQIAKIDKEHAQKIGDMT